MKLYEKVFVPSSEKESDGVYSGYNMDEINVKEQHNKYVLSEEELKDLLVKFHKNIDIRYKFDLGSDDYYESSAEAFLQSKLENKINK